jgi:hypothetical protein
MPANGETVLQALRCSLRELGRISLFERPDRDASELAAEMAPGPRTMPLGSAGLVLLTSSPAMALTGCGFQRSLALLRNLRCSPASFVLRFELATRCLQDENGQWRRA